MSYAIMPKRGEPDICDTECSHKDCAQWRSIIDQPCALCEQPVTSGQRFVLPGPALRHWVCELKDADER